jgi:type III pantothenate kinase
MNLLLDVGNSRVKWARIGNATLLASDAFEHQHGRIDVVDLDKTVLGHAPKAVWVSCVAGSEPAAIISRWATRRWSISPRFARVHPSAFGVRCGYRDPSLLGVDRWLALIAARIISPDPWCVVDAGTAITGDVLSSDGHHLGGVILPGLALMRRSLASATGALPEVAGYPLRALGDCTTESILAGTLHAACGAIERLCHAASLSLDTVPGILLTGGDAHSLASVLEAPCRVEPDLVLRGLRYMAEGSGNED